MGKKARILREKTEGVRGADRRTTQQPVSAAVPRGRNKYLPHDGGGQFTERATPLYKGVQ